MSAIVHPAPKGTGTIPFIEGLRAIACLLVVYCHILAGRADLYHYDWPFYVFVRDFFVAPLGIIQNFGFFGVALFFLVSGFIITHTVQREDRIAFCVKRVFRIFPPLIGAVIAVLALHWIDFRATGVPNQTVMLRPHEVLLSTVALNALFNAGSVIVVGWTLTIELLFYANVVLLNTMLRRSAWWAALTFIALPTVLIRLCIEWGLTKSLGVNIGQLATLSEYLPVFGIGMVIYYGWAGRLSVGKTVALAVTAWIALVYNLSLMQPFNLLAPTSHTTQIAYVIVVFVAGMWLWQNVERNPAWLRFFSNISYSLYLIHYPFGLFAMDRLHGRIGFTAAALVSLTLVTGMSYLSFRFIEKPSQRLARKILSLRHRADVELPKGTPVAT
ncbi:MAG TPA: acyltransferase [Chthoniobacterales bacterium]|nr:acyltransferase [Chthoniobacterales bacterium]